MIDLPLPTCCHPTPPSLSRSISPFLPCCHPTPPHPAIVRSPLLLAVDSSKQATPSTTEPSMTQLLCGEDMLDHLPVASSSSSVVASRWKKFNSFDVFLNYDNVFTDRHFKHHLSDELVTAGIQISPYFHLLAGSRHQRTSEVRASIVILLMSYC